MTISSFSILGLKTASFSYSGLLHMVELEIAGKKKFAVTYNNAACSVTYHKDEFYRNALRKFSVIHPDGIGVYMAARFLFPGVSFQRMTGSDFYPILIEKAIEKQWSIFIFGDTNETLKKIPDRYPSLRIIGMSPGYGFADTLPEQMAELKPDLVLVGMGVPKQEIWISENWEKLPEAVFMAVGDGIKVLSGTKKRGWIFIQKTGLEWVVRLISEPLRLWRRYLVWMPVFIILVVIQKFRGKSE